MVEISDPKDEDLIREVCSKVENAVANGDAVEQVLRNVFEVDTLVMEVNSGASYEQYFRWADCDQIAGVVDILKVVGLKDVAEMTQNAVMAAFPDGVPTDPDDKDEQTDWSEEQEETLEKLFSAFEEQNGVISRALAKYIREIK